MTFLQTISFHTDQIDRFEELDRRWIEETEGRRTLVHSALYRDRTDPTHYVAVNYFASYDEAQVNSALPETDALAREAMTMSTGAVDFTDLDLVTAFDPRERVAAGIRQLLETNEPPAGLLHDDVRTDLFVPQWHVVERGVEELLAGLRADAPGRSIEQWDVHPIADGVIVEYSGTNHASAEQPETWSVGTLVARLRAGKVASIRVHCAGNWTAEQRQEIAESQGTTVSA
jgi:quinol monooxygenase YgiN